MGGILIIFVMQLFKDASTISDCMVFKMMGWVNGEFEKM
jgi:hypothetical protein